MSIYNYSIIIPHKDITDLLQRCLNSIPEREDVQIIIVDDNSNTEIVDFSLFPGLKRKNVEIIFSKEEGNAGYARNLGLGIAKGKWILFLDADDIFNDCLNNILDEYINDPADIIYFKNNSIHKASNKKLNRGKWLNEFVDIYFDNPKKGEKLLRYLFVVPWGKLIKKNLIDTFLIKFDETKINNDITFSYLTGFHAACVKADLRELYCWIYRENSLSEQKKEPNIILDIIYVNAKALIFYRRLRQGIRLKRAWLEIFSYLRLFYLSNKQYYVKAKEILLNAGFSNIEIIFGLNSVLIFKQYIFSKTE